MDLRLATIENFNEVAYLIANPDIANLVMEGKLSSGFDHFIKTGCKESRSQVRTDVTDAMKDRAFLRKDVPLSDRAKHSLQDALAKSIACKSGMKVLEIGSRRVTSNRSMRAAVESAGATYVGFDYHPGENVDIVGDAHKLTSYFNHKFDFIYSTAVFEHLAMPWVVAVEIAKLLEVGGSLLLETHFSFSSHERPWHFFQFSDMALKCLFSPALGFECIEAGMSNPMVGRFSSLADSYLKRSPITGLYCHSDFYGVKVKEIDLSNFDWSLLNTSEVVENSQYPSPP